VLSTADDPPLPRVGILSRRVQMRLDNIVGKLELRLGPKPVPQWTPFANQASRDADPAAIAALAKALADKQPAVDRCYDGARGSVRAIVALGADGVVTGARVGGLGDRTAERCIATALTGVRAPPPPAALELACDFARGG